MKRYRLSRLLSTLLLSTLAIALLASLPGCGGGGRGHTRGPRQPDEVVVRPGATRPEAPGTPQAVPPPVDLVRYYPGETWEKVPRPEEVGYSSAKLAEAETYARQIGSDAVVVVVGGRVLAEWGDAADRSNIHSCRKSLLSALYGIAVAEGQVNLSSTLGELKIDDNEPALSDVEKQATVQQLLQARSGVYHDALYETAGMEARRPERGSHAPGTFFYYNNWDFNALGTILERGVGESLFSMFSKRIAIPLKMQDFRLEDCRYVRGADSIHPAYPFRLSARDMARFGLLYARDGQWDGQQIIPREWVAESTHPHSVRSRGGYGYLWWVAVDGKSMRNLDMNRPYFSAQGNHGQVIFVCPGMDLVIVHRVDTDIRGRDVAAGDIGTLLRMIVDSYSGQKVAFDFTGVAGI